MARRLRSSFFDRRYTALPSGEAGSTGGGEAGAQSNSWYAEVIGGGPDVNPELTGSAKFRIFDEMALTDPTIKGLLQFWSLPIRAAVWGLNPRNETPIAQAIRDMVAWNVGLEGELGEMDLSWRGQLGLTITAGLKCGPALEELVWADDVRTWRDADGDAHIVRPLARLAPRPARTIAKVVRRNGIVTEVTQLIPGTQPIAADKLSYIVFDPDDTGRWEGSSMIRPAWAAWRMKKALQIAAGIGWDRFSSGLPVIYHPDNEEAEQIAKTIGRKIRTNERAYVNLPTKGESVDGKPSTEWFIELMNGAQTLADPTPLLKYFTEQESEAGLAQFSRLGQTGSGSRATAEVQIDPFFLGVQSVALDVARERERQVIRRIVEVNFGQEAAEDHTPILTVSKIQAQSPFVIAQAISYLAPAGFTFTDRGVQNDMRELLGLALIPDAADAGGVTVDALQAALGSVGLDANTVAAVVNALPEGVGIIPNRLPAEGSSVLAAAA